MRIVTWAFFLGVSVCSINWRILLSDALPNLYLRRNDEGKYDEERYDKIRNDINRLSFLEDKESLENENTTEFDETNNKNKEIIQLNIKNQLKDIKPLSYLSSPSFLSSQIGKPPKQKSGSPPPPPPRAPTTRLTSSSSSERPLLGRQRSLSLTEPPTPNTDESSSLPHSHSAEPLEEPSPPSPPPPSPPPRTISLGRGRSHSLGNLLSSSEQEQFPPVSHSHSADPLEESSSPPTGNSTRGPPPPPPPRSSSLPLLDEPSPPPSPPSSQKSLKKSPPPPPPRPSAEIVASLGFSSTSRNSSDRPIPKPRKFRPAKRGSTPLPQTLQYPMKWDDEDEPPPFKPVPPLSRSHSSPSIGPKPSPWQRFQSSPDLFTGDGSQDRSGDDPQGASGDDPQGASGGDPQDRSGDDPQGASGGEPQDPSGGDPQGASGGDDEGGKKKKKRWWKWKGRTKRS